MLILALLSVKRMVVCRLVNRTIRLSLFRLWFVMAVICPTLVRRNLVVMTYGRVLMVLVVGCRLMIVIILATIMLRKNFGKHVMIIILLFLVRLVRFRRIVILVVTMRILVLLLMVRNGVVSWNRSILHKVVHRKILMLNGAT